MALLRLFVVSNRETNNFPSLFSSIMCLCIEYLTSWQKYGSSIQSTWTYRTEHRQHSREDKVREFPFSWTLNWLNFSLKCVCVCLCCMGAAIHAILHMPILLFDLFIFFFFVSFVLFVGFSLHSRHNTICFNLEKKKLSCPYSTHYLHIDICYEFCSCAHTHTQHTLHNGNERGMHMLTPKCRYQKIDKKIK